jgi:site-specific DNA-cytosine methylase
MTLGYYEFFAGGGMARAGLGPNWTCLFANDIDLKKARSYATNWGEHNFVARDVACRRDQNPREFQGARQRHADEALDPCWALLTESCERDAASLDVGYG